jgi:ABC-type dipeptide/oligopeptide/nickel transport system permease component
MAGLRVPPILRFIALRLLLALPALWLILTMVFLLVHIVPGDPVAQMLGEGARAEDLEQLRHALNLDQPIRLQYLHYIAGVVRGDLGTSFRFQQPVAKVIAEHYPATLQLSFIALAVCAFIGIFGGVLAARKRGTATDTTVGVLTLFGLSVPNFALGPVLMLVFAVIFGWLPVSGRGGVSHIVLPAFTLGAALAAILTRMVRISVIEELSSDYVRTARAKGLPESSVLFKHAFRNALIPILTILSLQFGALLAGTIVTETIFAWPGVGRVTVQAINARDYPLLQGCILLIAVTYVFVNLLTDVIYAVVDPRVRFE